MPHRRKSNTGFKKDLVSVVGLGYVGLPTAAVIASKGYKVLGIDINCEIVNAVNKGQIHIIEPELETLIDDVVSNGFLRVAAIPEPAQVFIIAVSTPIINEIEPDLSFVDAAILSIIPLLQKGNLIIIESTLPVGSTEKIAMRIAQERPDLKIPSINNNEFADIYIAYCPERVLPGKIIEELKMNDRVIGGITPTCTEKAVAFYNGFVEGRCLPTNSKTAELVKLAENAFRDVNIAFANELSMICDELDTNVWELINLANHHPRVNILNPSPGVGGHCIAIDPLFIVNACPETTKLIKIARQVNKDKTEYAFKKILKAALTFKNPVIAFLGLTYKENIDDLRESPALEIVEKIAQATEYRLIIIEPHIKELPAKLKTGYSTKMIFSQSLNSLIHADIIVHLVPHEYFNALPDTFKDKKIIHLCKKNNEQPPVYLAKEQEVC